MSNFQHRLGGKGLNWVHTVDTEHQPFQVCPPTCPVRQGALKHQIQVLASGFRLASTNEKGKAEAEKLGPTNGIAEILRQRREKLGFPPCWTNLVRQPYQRL